ncbi:hypothetical protein Bbelb_027990 [Branchiostoma belcheri]|nr:hypothetical protein Bbelb_027990 [Branchiostoma belcheri]
MKTARKVPVGYERHGLVVVFLLVCFTQSVTGVVDVTIASKYQFFDESDDTWLYCYYTGSVINQNRSQFGVEVDTGSGTGFTRQRSSGVVTGGRGVRILDNAGDFRVGAFSCQVSDGSQTEKAITFKIKSQARGVPRAHFPIVFAMPARCHCAQCVPVRPVRTSAYQCAHCVPVRPVRTSGIECKISQELGTRHPNHEIARTRNQSFGGRSVCVSHHETAGECTWVYGASVDTTRHDSVRACGKRITNLRDTPDLQSE